MSRAEQFERLDPEAERRWTTTFQERTTEMYPGLLGFVIEEVRRDYCRIRMPFSPRLLQPGGVVHGGAISSLLDAAVVPAIGSGLGRDDRFATIDQHVQFLGALTDDDAVAEGWVVRRGRRIVFCESEVTAATSSALVARSVLTYSVAAR